MRTVEIGHQTRVCIICTYNTRTINDLNLDSRDILLQEIKSIKWDVIGLCETKIKNSDMEDLEGGHRIYSSGNEESRSNGFGFLVDCHLVPLVIDYQGIFNCIALLTLQGENNKISILQVYFPTTKAPHEEVERLYDPI